MPRQDRMPCGCTMAMFCKVCDPVNWERFQALYATTYGKLAPDESGVSRDDALVIIATEGEGE